ncbi:MAG: M15 family metallopeptidase [Actinomycetota bacterium]
MVLRRLARALVFSLLAALLVVPGVALAGGQPAFEGAVSRLDRPTKRLMTGKSWRPGCPVKLRDLRYVRLRIWTFDRVARWGELVVHERVADRMVRAFRDIYEARFPIRRMRLVDHYNANDTRSMKHDNTSAFNCRWRAGSPGVWSMHAYGKAIDINPVENPYYIPSSNYVSPKRGRKFVDRSKRRRGMIYKRDVVWRAFRDIGWEWGGTWRNVKDWQHFSTNHR